jgi:hypothetical protein
MMPITDALSSEFRELDPCELREDTGFGSIPVSAHALRAAVFTSCEIVVDGAADSVGATRGCCVAG